jgi:quercetin dioxygenase-like cupin family protein
MNEFTFSAFEASTKAQGFDEALVRQWQPLTVVGVHTHPFAAKALVVGGEMWLTVGERTQHLLAGDTFELDAEVPHSERYGPDGACYWVARRAATAR